MISTEVREFLRTHPQRKHYSGSRSRDPLGRKLLSPMEARVLNALLVRQGSYVYRNELIEIVYGHRAPLTAERSISIYITNLQEYGWPIISHYGRGCMIPWRGQWQ